MLTFIGLGLYDQKDITLKGLEAIRKADIVYAEFYTSALTGTTLDEMERLYGKKIILLSREEVEEHPTWLEEAKTRSVVFLSGGDTMISTTHLDLRLRALDLGIETRLIHGLSISSSAVGLSCLQNYRFGKSTTIPFPYLRGNKVIVSETPYDVIRANRKNDLHTLVFLDIDKEKGHMTINEGIRLLLSIEEKREDKLLRKSLFIGIARAGSEKPVVKADYPEILRDCDFGPPLHILIIPASLHFLEAEALVKLAGAPEKILAEPIPFLIKSLIF
jgi:diphthine synthase